MITLNKKATLYLLVTLVMCMVATGLYADQSHKCSSCSAGFASNCSAASSTDYTEYNNCVKNFYFGLAIFGIIATLVFLVYVMIYREKE